MCNDTGDLEKANEYYQLALEIQKEQYGPNYVHVGDRCINFGIVYSDTGDLEKEKEYYQRVYRETWAAEAKF